jgi:hypothetical protein
VRPFVTEDAVDFKHIVLYIYIDASRYKKGTRVMFSKLITASILSLLLSNSAEASYVYRSTDSPDADYWTMNCHVDKVESETPQKMTVNNITVSAQFDSKDVNLLGISITHHLLDGTDISRAEQYPNAGVATLYPGHMNYIWKGNIKNSALSMIGHLVFEENRITYSEESFQYGKIRYRMDSTCKVIEIKEPRSTEPERVVPENSTRDKQDTH